MDANIGNRANGVRVRGVRVRGVRVRGVRVRGVRVRGVRVRSESQRSESQRSFLFEPDARFFQVATETLLVFLTSSSVNNPWITRQLLVLLQRPKSPTSKRIEIQPDKT